MAAEKINEKLKSEKIEVISSKPEKPLSPEAKTEQVLTSSEKPLETPKPQEKPGEGISAVNFQAQTYQTQRAQEIDNILAEGLNEIFLKMTPLEQKKFKETGEETTAKINQLLNQAKIKVNKIISLIKRWLKLIPHVNKFFLEQEAKIKADKIIHLKNK